MPSQVAVPLGGIAQAVQRLPQLPALALETQEPLHKWKPAEQTKPHARPLQVAVPLAVAGQAVHESPQDATLVLATQALPQAWKPELQANPQAEPLQVAVALVGAGQAVHEVPHDVTLLFETQVLPQRCWLWPQPFNPALSSSVCAPSSEGNTHPTKVAAPASTITNATSTNRFIVSSSWGVNDGWTESSHPPSDFPPCVTCRRRFCERSYPGRGHSQVMRADVDLRVLGLLCISAMCCSSTRQDDVDASSSPPSRDAVSIGTDDAGQAEGSCALPLNDSIPAGGACSDMVTHCATGTDNCLSTALRATLVPAFAACQISCGDMSIGFSAGCATVLEVNSGVDPVAADCLRNILFHSRYDCVPTDGWQRLFVGSCTLP